MIQNAEARLDGTTLVVRIPMRFQRRVGRKRIVAPDGTELLPTSKPQPDSTLVKALARAWRWQRVLEKVFTLPLARLLTWRVSTKAISAASSGWRCWRRPS